MAWGSSLPKARRRGSTVVVTLIIGAVIGLVLAGYLSLISARNTAIMRSQAWNECIAVAEAGLEEALTHARNNQVTNMLANGWTLSDGTYFRTRQIGSNYFRVRISTTVPYVFESEGYVHLPWNNTYIVRRLRIETISQGMFSKAMVVKNSVDMNGNNILVDSYDSRDPMKSTLGRYDASKAQANGDVACTDGLVNSFTVGNANIWGRVITGPKGTVAVGPSGAVGSKSWQLSGSSGVEPGYWLTDMNMNFPPVKEPYSSAASPTSNGSYDYIVDDGNYICSSLSGRVLVRGNATLYVTGDVDFRGTEELKIQNGGNLKLYVGGKKASFQKISNENAFPNATNFYFYGLPTCKNLDLSQNTELVGVVYAPHAHFKFYGGLEVYGAIVGNKGTLTGHSKFHYDEALTPVGPPRGFIVSSWTEL
jgi:hypothetical protein